jgi:hypothetical protein
VPSLLLALDYLAHGGGLKARSRPASWREAPPPLIGTGSTSITIECSFDRTVLSICGLSAG